MIQQAHRLWIATGQRVCNADGDMPAIAGLLHRRDAEALTKLCRIVNPSVPYRYLSVCTRGGENSVEKQRKSEPDVSAALFV